MNTNKTVRAMKYALLGVIVLLATHPFDATAQDEKERVLVLVDARKGNAIREASNYQAILQSSCYREIRDLGYTELLPDDVFA